MVKIEMAERLKEDIERILCKDLSIKDIQAVINAHTNVLDSDMMILEQIQDKKVRGLIP